MGSIFEEITAQTGLPPSVKVASGIHDSNASILPYLHTQKDPFCVVSTGTWVVSMAVGGQNIELSEENDTLYNVNALGQPLPSAQFMGGREFELLGGAGCPMPTEDEIQPFWSAERCFCQRPFPQRDHSRRKNAMDRTKTRTVYRRTFRLHKPLPRVGHQ